MTQTSRTAYRSYIAPGLEERPVRAYEPQGENDPFVWACCKGTKPAHTSRCRNAY